MSLDHCQTPEFTKQLHVFAMVSVKQRAAKRDVSGV